MSDDKLFYRETAQYYDPSYAVKADLNDIDFYVDLAKSVGGHTLEVGCGTGRVLIPTARAGVKIDGLDFSEDLLTLLEDKLEPESASVQQLVTLHRGDMRKFSLENKYDLITVPFRPLQHLYTVEDQLKTFSCLSAHLKPKGQLCFNVFYPNHATLAEIGTPHYELEWPDPADPTIRITRTFIKRSLYQLDQYFEAEFIYQHLKGEELLEEKIVPFKMSYYTYPHIKLLLHSAGLKIKEQYGSFEKEPIEICKEMIIVAVPN